MDNLTHGLVGAGLARAGLERHTPLATTTLVVAANAPDVDILAFLEGDYAALAFRRGLTHGLPAMVVLPFLVAGAVLAWDRGVRRRWKPEAPPARPRAVLTLSVAGLLTHPALDWMNTYGMRWWLPFDGGWSYGDALFIVDPWIWLILGGAVALTGRRSTVAAAGWGLLAALTTALVLWAPVPWIAKGVWSAGVAAVALAWGWGRIPAWAEPPDGRRVPARRPGARAALAVVTLYVALMVAADLLARRDVHRTAEQAGLGPPLDLMVAPLPAHPLAADVLVRTGETYVHGSHRWLRSPRTVLRVDSVLPAVEWSADVPAPRVEAISRAAWRADRATDFRVWTRYPRMRIDRTESGYHVRISDMRYRGRGAGSLEGLTVRLDDTLRVVPPGQP